MGFRKLDVDLYWDAGRQIWSLCPPAIPPSPQSSATSSALTGLASSIATGSATGLPISSSSESPTNLGKRTNDAITSASQISDSTTLTSSSTSALLTHSVLENSNISYTCSSSINLSAFTSLLLDFIQRSETTVGAHMIYLALNIHAAPSASTSVAATAPSSSYPPSSSSPGSYFRGPLAEYLYTPSQLLQDRANLNDSWYTVARNLQPDPAYFITKVGPGNIHYTPDGWPSEGFVEVSKGKRLFVGWGTIDPQMQGYKLDGDSGIVFPSGYIQSSLKVSGSTLGQVNTGCYFDASETNLAKVNSSWSFSSGVEGFSYPTANTASLEPTLNLFSNLSSCGINPFVNWTILNWTASQDFSPYQRVAQGTTWSWAAEEPLNYTGNDSDSGSTFRCAFMDATSNGRWRVRQCSENYYGACRDYNEPYSWRLTSYPTTYNLSSQLCPLNSSFGVPRTGLENAYLYAKIRNQQDISGKGIWVDFNSLHIEGCWVSGGQNATCPYYVRTDLENRRVVLVPLIGALIVLLIAALTVFVKCNAQRRLSRRKRRREGGWDYEG